MSYRSVFILLVSFLVGFNVLHSQMYDDFIGDGHEIGVTVTSSTTSSGDLSEHTITGNKLGTDLEGASRFLAQATMGANYESIEQLSQTGIESWLSNQFNMPASSYYSKYVDIFNDANTIIMNDDDRSDYMSFTFYEMILEEPDVLRQKTAFALSQIFVIAAVNSTLQNRGYFISDYYDLLYQGSFGNFRDLLMNVTMHPAMGTYLSHFQNQKADVVLGTYPDENYAREIMQLFTIGLHELNNDGTIKLDANGEVKPTYDIEDIQELSKVFTGLAGGAAVNGTVSFFTGFGNVDPTVTMAMYESYHEQSEKIMIDGTILPSGRAGMEDVNDAIDIIFNHDNVGPFISTRLIQQLVKSNPTPAYVNRVATIFNNNGSGVRGDMQAVINAILIDPEARDCIWIDDVKAGKLLQPIERFTNLFRGFDISTPSGRMYFRDHIEIYDELEQAFLASPSVFNFYSPFFAEQDYVAPNDLVSPEFQILHSTSGIHYLNLIENSIKIQPFYNRTSPNSTNQALRNNSSDKPVLDFVDEINIYNAGGLSALLDRLDLILCRGQLSDSTKAIIANTINENIANVNNYDASGVIQDALYYIMMSPSYVILK